MVKDKPQMTHMRYEEIPQLAQSQIARQLCEMDEKKVAIAILSSALYGTDPEWTEARCVELLTHESKVIRAAALTSIGHNCRIHRRLHNRRTLAVLYVLRGDPELGGRADDALDDIRMFVDPAV